MKNNKKLPLPLIIVGVLILAAAAYFVFGRSGGNSLTGNDPASLVTNALNGSGSVKCEYTDESGNLITAYVKGEKMRTDMTGEEGNMSMIYKDKTSWSWDSTTKQGMMYKMPEVTPVEGETETEMDMESEMDDSEEMKAEIEQYKDSCKNESIADSVFEVPTDVTFQDFSQMMQGQMENLPAEYQQYMPQ